MAASRQGSDQQKPPVALRTTRAGDATFRIECLERDEQELKMKIRSLEQDNELLQERVIAYESTQGGLSGKGNNQEIKHLREKVASMERSELEIINRNTELEKEIVKLRSMKQELGDELLVMKSNTELLKNELEKSSDVNRSLQEKLKFAGLSNEVLENDSSENVMETLRARITQLEYELKIKVSEIEHIHNLMDEDEILEHVEEMVQELEDLRSHNQELEGKIARMEENTGDEISSETRCQQLEHENEELHYQILQLQHLEKQYSDKLKHAVSTIDDLETSETRLRDDVDAYTRDEGNIRQQLSDSRVIIEELRDQIADKDLIEESLQEKVDFLEKCNEANVERLRGLENNESLLKQRLEIHAEMEKNIDYALSLKDRVEALEEVNTKLQAKVTELEENEEIMKENWRAVAQEDATQLQLLEERLRMVELLNQELRKKLKNSGADDSLFRHPSAPSLLAEMSNSSSRMRFSIAPKDNALDEDSQSKIRELEDQLHLLTEEKNSKIEKLQHKVDDMRVNEIKLSETLVEMEQEERQLRERLNQLESSESAATVNKYEKRIKALKSSEKDLLARMDSLENKEDDLKDKLAFAERKYQQHLEKMERIISDYQRSEEEMQTKIDQLQRENDQLNEKLLKFDREIATPLRNENNELKDLSCDLTERVKSDTEKIKTLQDEFRELAVVHHNELQTYESRDEGSLQQEVESYQNEIVQLKALVDNQSDVVRQYQVKVSHLEMELNGAHAQCRDLDKKVADNEKVINKLNCEVKDCQAEMTKFGRLEEELNVELKRNRLKIQQYQNEEKQVNEKVKQYQSEIDQLECVVNEMKDKVVDYEMKLLRYKDEVSTLKEEQRHYRKKGLSIEQEQFRSLENLREQELKVQSLEDIEKSLQRRVEEADKKYMQLKKESNEMAVTIREKQNNIDTLVDEKNELHIKLKEKLEEFESFTTLHSEETKKFEGQIKDFMVKIRGLERERDELLMKVDNKEKSMKISEKEYAKKIHALEKNEEDFLKKIKTLEKHEEELMEKDVANVTQINCFEAEIVSLQKRMNELNELNATNMKCITALESDKAKLTSKVAEVIAERDSLHSHSICHHETEIYELKLLSNGLDEKNKEYKVEINKLNEKVEILLDAEEHLMDKNMELEKLNAELEKCLTEHTEASDHNQTLLVENLQSKVHNLEQANQMLGSELTDLNENDVASMSEKVMLLEQSEQKLMERIADLEEAESKLDAENSKSLMLSANIDKMKTDLSILKDDNERLEKDAMLKSEQFNELEALLFHKDTKISELEDLNTTLSGQLTEHIARVTELEAELEATEEKLEELQTEYEERLKDKSNVMGWSLDSGGTTDLQNEIEALQHSLCEEQEKNKALKGDLLILEKDREELMERIEGSNKNDTDMVFMSINSGSHSVPNSESNSNFVHLKETVEQLEKERYKNMNHIARLTDHLEKLSSSINVTTAALIQDLKLGHIIKEILQKSRIETLERELISMQDKETFKSNDMSLESKCAELQNREKYYIEEIDNFKRELTDLESRFKLKSAKTAGNFEVEEMREQIKDLENDRNAQRLELDKLNAYLQSFRAAVFDLVNSEGEMIGSLDKESATNNESNEFNDCESALRRYIQRIKIPQSRYTYSNSDQPHDKDGDFAKQLQYYRIKHDRLRAKYFDKLEITDHPDQFELHDRILHLETSEQTLTETIKQLERHNTDLQKQLESIHINYGSHADTLDLEKEEFKVKVEQLERTEKDLLGKLNQHEQLSTANLLDKITKLESSEKHLRRKLEYLERAEGDSAHRAATASTMFDKPQEVLQQQIIDMQVLERHLKDQISDLEHDREELHEITRKDKNIIHDQNIRLRELQLGEKTLKDQVNRYEMSEHLLYAKTENLESEVSKLRSRVKELEIHKVKLQEIIQQLKLDKEMQTVQSGTMETAMEEVRQSEMVLKKKLKEMEMEKTQFVTKCGELEERLKESEKQCVDTSSKCDSLVKDNEYKTKIIDQCKESSVTKDGVINDLRSQLASIKGDYGEAQDEKAALVYSSAQTTLKIQELEKKISEMKEVDEHLRHDLGNLEKNEKELLNKVQEYQIRDIETQGALRSVEQSERLLKDRVNSLQRTETRLKARIQELESQLSKERDFDAIDESSVDQWKVQVDHLKTENAELKENIDSLLSESTAQVQHLQNEVETFAAKQQEITQLQADNDILLSKVTDLEKLNQTLQNDLDKAVKDPSAGDKPRVGPVSEDVTPVSSTLLQTHLPTSTLNETDSQDGKIPEIHSIHGSKEFSQSLSNLSMLTDRWEERHWQNIESKMETEIQNVVRTDDKWFAFETRKPRKQEEITMEMVFSSESASVPSRPFTPDCRMDQGVVQTHGNRGHSVPPLPASHPPTLHPEQLLPDSFSPNHSSTPRYATTNGHLTDEDIIAWKQQVQNLTGKLETSEKDKNHLRDVMATLERDLEVKVRYINLLETCMKTMDELLHNKGTKSDTVLLDEILHLLNHMKRQVHDLDLPENSTKRDAASLQKMLMQRDNDLAIKGHELNKLRDELDAARAECHSTETMRVNALNSVHSLELKIVKLEGSGKELNDNYNALLDKFENLKEENSSLKESATEHDRIEQELRVLRDELKNHETLQAEFGVLSGKMAATEEALNSKIKSEDSLTHDIHVMREQINLLESRAIEQNELLVTMDNLKAMNDELESEKQTIANTIAPLESQIKTLLQKCQEKDAVIVTLERRLKSNSLDQMTLRGDRLNADGASDQNANQRGQSRSSSRSSSATSNDATSRSEITISLDPGQTASRDANQYQVTQRPGSGTPLEQSAAARGHHPHRLYSPANRTSDVHTSPKATSSPIPLLSSTAEYTQPKKTANGTVTRDRDKSRTDADDTVKPGNVKKSSPGRGSNGDRETQTSESRFRLKDGDAFVAIADYNPQLFSRNGNHQELSLTEGDRGKVLGPPNSRGFYEVCVGDRRGLVPGSYIQAAPLGHRIIRPIAQRRLHKLQVVDPKLDTSPEQILRLKADMPPADGAIHKPTRRQLPNVSGAHVKSPTVQSKTSHSASPVKTAKVANLPERATAGAVLPPTNLCVVRSVGDSGVMLSWSPPPMDDLARSNGHEIQGYKVFCNGYLCQEASSPHLTKALIEHIDLQRRHTFGVQTVTTTDRTSKVIDIIFTDVERRSLSDAGSEANLSSILSSEHYDERKKRLFLGLYDYTPDQQSPNDYTDFELPFRTGDLVMVFGRVRSDGFYHGEINGKRGLVPESFIQELPRNSLIKSGSSSSHGSNPAKDTKR